MFDDDFIIWDSHAICAYLVDRYAKDDKLYPKDLQLRAKCNQRLFFDASTLCERLRDAQVAIFLIKGAVAVPDEKIDSIYNAYNILEAFLESDPFLVGENLTIADISAAVNILALELFIPLKADEHSKIRAWLDRVKEMAPVLGEING